MAEPICLLSFHLLSLYSKWNDNKQIGPAIHTPTVIKDTIVNEYCIKWLNLSEPQKFFYLKNHMVATMRFATPQFFRNKKYLSAQISMKVGIGKKVVEIVGQEVCSTHISIST